MEGDISRVQVVGSIFIPGRGKRGEGIDRYWVHGSICVAPSSSHHLGQAAGTDVSHRPRESIEIRAFVYTNSRAGEFNAGH